MISITVKSRAKIDLDRFARKMPDLNKKALEPALNVISELVKTRYLKGPPPVRLKSRSGDLRRSIKTYVAINGDVAVGHIGTSEKSRKGYNYPRRWEYGKGARPFLTPAIENHIQKWVKVWRLALIEQIDNWIKANRGSK